MSAKGIYSVTLNYPRRICRHFTEKEGLLRNSAGYRGLETGLLERRGCHHSDRRGLGKKRGRVQRFSRRLSRMQVRKTKEFSDFTILKSLQH